MADDGSVQRSVDERSRMVVSLHHRLEDLNTLQDRWAELAANAGASAALTYEYVATAWRLMASREDVELNILSVAVDDELIAMWPLYIERVGRLRIAKHLGSSADEEYAGPLISEHARGEEAVVEMIAAIRPRADMLKIYNVAHGNVATRVLDRTAGLKHKSFVRSPIVSVPADGGWDAWLAAKSKSFRTELRYKRNKLARLGEIRFCRIEGRAEIERVIAWIFDVKRASLLAHNNRTSWVFQPYGQTFFAEAAQASDQVNIYALMVGDMIAAAAILFESRGLMEYFATSYNHDLHAHSPGNLLLEELVKTAFAAGRAFDFRITSDEIKERWRDTTERYDSYIIATSPRGLAPTMKSIAKRAEVDLKIALKAKLAAMKKPAKAKPSTQKASNEAEAPQDQ
jgi:CelD/BcsL family acetyltransferase involved in cellulose biosynthesis